MAIKDMIGAGIGFDPGSILYIFTRGLDIGVVFVPEAGPERSLLVRGEQRALAVSAESRTLLVTR